MNFKEKNIFGLFPAFANGWHRLFALGVLLLLYYCAAIPALAAAPKSESGAADPVSDHGFNITGFTVEGRYLLSTNVMVALFSKYAGTNVTLEEIRQAACDLEFEYLREGYPSMNIVVAPKRIANGIVTLDVFPGAVPQVVMAGRRYLVSSNAITLAATQALRPASSVADTNKVATSTNSNAGPFFTVNSYQIIGNTLLPPEAVNRALTNVSGAFGTNVDIAAIREVVLQIRTAYRERGFVTVDVTLPPQRLTNATVQLQVTEGQLHAILVKGNHYFSSNNVMRAVPGLHLNTILNDQTFEAQLNRANASQDRQIYPIIEAGPEPGTSDLTLQVKDRFPFHGKIELNNQSTPGTPDLRVNASAVYNNLWQLENALGVQYGFAPGEYKLGDRWNFYDKPLVANYSAFYRMPLGGPSAIDEQIAADPGSFGYNEATRKFNLPPAIGQPSLTFFGSRSTIDTGIEELTDRDILNVPGIRTITLESQQQDLTINNDLGFRLAAPFLAPKALRCNFTAGMDFKDYFLNSTKTNIFTDLETTYDENGNPTTQKIKTFSRVPLTISKLRYLPVSVQGDAALDTSWGTASFGLGVSANTCFSGSVSNIQKITSSTKSTGYWVIVNPKFSWQFSVITNWVTTIRADGQVTTEPLISNEQFGAGGVNSVRGYHEGQVFGDDGWHVGLEELTPPYKVGMVYGRNPLVIRGSFYTDYARLYLLDPLGRADNQGLWGAGFGCEAYVGPYWQARLLFSVPLLDVPGARAYVPYFNFALTAQF